MKYRDPIKGEKIYVGTNIYVYRGEDDFIGGLATISEVEYSKTLPKSHFNHVFIKILERPGTSYNWKPLLEKQKEYKELYGDKIARQDPDLRPEFNCPNADWQ